MGYSLTEKMSLTMTSAPASVAFGSMNRISQLESNMLRREAKDARTNKVHDAGCEKSVNSVEEWRNICPGRGGTILQKLLFFAISLSVNTITPLRSPCRAFVHLISAIRANASMKRGHPNSMSGSKKADHSESAEAILGTFECLLHLLTSTANASLSKSSDASFI